MKSRCGSDGLQVEKKMQRAISRRMSVCLMCWIVERKLLVINISHKSAR